MLCVVIALLVDEEGVSVLLFVVAPLVDCDCSVVWTVCVSVGLNVSDVLPIVPGADVVSVGLEAREVASLGLLLVIDGVVLIAWRVVCPSEVSCGVVFVVSSIDDDV